MLKQITNQAVLYFSYTVILYVIIIGIPYLIFCFKNTNRLKNFQIFYQAFNPKQFQHELLHTLKSFEVLILINFISAFIIKSDYYGNYQSIDEKGYLYYFLSIVMVILAHDTYFYWTHYLMHKWPWLYNKHLVHHKSHGPTPLSAFSFHPIESFIQFIFFPMIFLLPVHQSVYWIFYIFMLLSNSAGHLNYEFYPAKIYQWPITNTFNAATHHNMHHKYVHYNFGIYYLWWDKWLGTLHPDYYKNYKANISRRNQS